MLIRLSGQAGFSPRGFTPTNPAPTTLTVTGALVNFIGTGNQINITNTLCSSFTCSSFSNIRVALGSTANPANISITNPIRNPAGGTINLSANGALMFVDGPARVTVLGQ